MAGNSIRKERWERMRLQGEGIPDGREQYWYLHNGSIVEQGADVDTWYDNAEEIRGASFFGRLMYDYAGKYLLSATTVPMAAQSIKRWGYFLL